MAFLSTSLEMSGWHHHLIAFKISTPLLPKSHRFFQCHIYIYITLQGRGVHLGISWNWNCSLQTFLFRKKKAEVVEPAVISEELLIEGVEELNFVAGKQLFTPKKHVSWGSPKIRLRHHGIIQKFISIHHSTPHKKNTPQNSI